MASPIRDNQKGARMLAEWAMAHFRESKIVELSLKYAMGESTMWLWKKRMDKDRQLRLIYEERLNELLDKDWGDKLNQAISKGITKIEELMTSSQSLPETTEAVKALAEIKITREVLAPNAANGNQNTESREAVATPQTYTAN